MATRAPTPICPKTCFRRSCDFWVADGRYDCPELEELGCDCGLCDCGRNGSTTEAPTLPPTLSPSAAAPAIEPKRASSTDGPGASVIVIAVAVVAAVAVAWRLYAAVRAQRLRLAKVASAGELMEGAGGLLRGHYAAAFTAAQSCLWDVCGVPLSRTLSRTEYLGLKYNDARGDAHRAMATLHVGGGDRLAWLDLWARADRGGANLVGRADFLKFVGLYSDSAYAEKVFDLFDGGGLQGVRFVGFFTQAWAVCAVDRKGCERLAFRLLSRGRDLDEAKSVADLSDFEHFVAKRYPSKAATAKRRAFHLFSHIDADGSGGVSFAEFCKFSETNRVILALGHAHQLRLRQKIFGEAYWLRQTRKRKLLFTFDAHFEAKVHKFAVDHRLLLAAPGDAADQGAVTKQPGKCGGRRDSLFLAPQTVDEAQFWLDFPEVEESVVKRFEARRESASVLEALRARLRESLCQKLVDAIDVLVADPKTVRGAVARWRAVLRRTDSLEGTSSVHATIRRASARRASPHELVDAVVEAHA
eukprot:CAMPEP_0184186702 /NCGR_PEP_ID=MMETSP0976-20121227/559_1 /TAXON_ID=483370 /ORGANISM="non described non described, Strain CCMP2097" /LENGTH=528 /DNA_ID=CAMNT_0026491001 /DNA_START=98 /DNA_END=1681 /DNA_ORIENTATION=+